VYEIIPYKQKMLQQVSPMNTNNKYVSQKQCKIKELLQESSVFLNSFLFADLNTFSYSVGILF